MKSKLPKVLHKIADISLLEHVLLELSQLDEAISCTVVASDSLSAHPIFQELKNKHKFNIAIQKEQRGTAHALIAGLDDHKKYSAVIVTCGDTPLVRADTFSHLIAEHKTYKNQATCVCFRPEDAYGYGRVKLDEKGNVAEIIEQKSLKEDQQDISLCNSGIMMLDMKNLNKNLSKITPDATTGELYLTDIYEVANNQGGKCGKIVTTECEVMGINTRAQLAAADKVMQGKIVGRLIDEALKFYSLRLLILQEIWKWRQV